MFRLLNWSKFSRIKWTFVLQIKKRTDRISPTKCYIPKVEIKYYNVIIDQSIKNYLKTYDSIGNGQGDYYKTVCLLDYPLFKEYCKLIAMDLRKHQKLDADPKAIQQINFTGKPEKKCNNIFHYRRSKRNSFRFFKTNSYIILILFCFNIIFI